MADRARQREIVSQLIEASASRWPEAVDAEDSDGHTPLHVAAWLDGKMVPLLLQGGARLDARNPFG